MGAGQTVEQTGLIGKMVGADGLTQIGKGCHGEPQREEMAKSSIFVKVRLPFLVENSVISPY
jgi:hypothetical protein